MLNDCQAGSQFKGTILVTEWKENPFRNKSGSFITMTCQDASGSLTAKIWETKSSHFEYLKEKDIFYIEAFLPSILSIRSGRFGVVAGQAKHGCYITAIPTR